MKRDDNERRGWDGDVRVDSDGSVGDSEERGALAGADDEEAIELDDGGRSGRGRTDSAEPGIATLFLGRLRTGHK